MPIHLRFVIIAICPYLSFSELFYEIMSTAADVLHVMKYRTLIVDGGLELMWMNEQNQHCVARLKETK